MKDTDVISIWKIVFKKENALYSLPFAKYHIFISSVYNISNGTPNQAFEKISPSLDLERREKSLKSTIFGLGYLKFNRYQNQLIWKALNLHSAALEF